MNKSKKTNFGDDWGNQISHILPVRMPKGTTLEIVFIVSHELAIPLTRYFFKTNGYI